MNNADLTQPQREGLFSLLALGMYADGKLSLEEDSVITSKLEETVWESDTQRMVFLGNALTRARQLEGEDAEAEYLADCTTVFNTAESRQAALQTLSSLLESDGMTATEEEFLRKVRKALRL